MWEKAFGIPIGDIAENDLYVLAGVAFAVCGHMSGVNERWAKNPYPRLESFFKTFFFLISTDVRLQCGVKVFS